MIGDPAFDRHRGVLVIMAKAPQPGRVKTRLTPPYAPEAAADVYRCMLLDTIALARRTGVPTRLMVPEGDTAALADLVPGDIPIMTQRGAGLAEALDWVFDHHEREGFDRTVAIDSDSPNLPDAAVHEALTLLDSHDIVIGPTRDGGYYLVGARQRHEGLFATGSLGTSTALAALRERADARRLSCASTLEWYDVDTAEDLALLEHALRNDGAAAAPRTAALLEGWRRTGRLLQPGR